MRGYFDYNASSLLRPEAAAAMREWAEGGGGNPSSMHARGRRARLGLEDARRSLAELVGVPPRQVVFTSGATESNNTVMRALAGPASGRCVVLSGLEHHSIVTTADGLEGAGTTIVRLGAGDRGDVEPGALARAVAQRPCLVTLGWANGETGHVTDVEAVVDAMRGHACEGSFLLLDAAQAAGRIPLAMTDGIDAVSMSAHKFGAPPGIGVLVFSERLRGCLQPLLTGGPHEHGLRAGTPNVPGALAAGAAARAAASGMRAESARLGALRERLWTLLAEGDPTLLRITPQDGLPNTLTVAVAGGSSDALIAALDLAGFCVSAGSACAAGSPEPSHVAAALGIPPDYRGGVVRISMGWATEPRAVEELAAGLLAVAGRAKAVAS